VTASTAGALLRDRYLEAGPVDSVVAEGRHWRLCQGEDGIAWLLFDRAGESINTLSEEVLSELDQMIQRASEIASAGLVLRSTKPSGFAAGADIHEFRGNDDTEEVRRRPLA